MPSDEKIKEGIRLNVYDAAHGWRDTMGDNRGIRAILADPDFRQAWIDFRGAAGGKKVLGKRRPKTDLKTKRNAAELFGWDREDKRFYEHLRGASP